MQPELQKEVQHSPERLILARHVILTALDDICPRDVSPPYDLVIPDLSQVSELEKSLDEEAGSLVESFRVKWAILLEEQEAEIAEVLEKDNTQSVSVKLDESAQSFRKTLERWRAKNRYHLKHGTEEKKAVLEAEKQAIIAARNFQQKRILNTRNSRSLELRVRKLQEGQKLRRDRFMLSFARKSDFYEAKLLAKDTIRNSVAWFADDPYNVAFWCLTSGLPLIAIYQEARLRAEAVERVTEEFNHTYEKVIKGEINCDGRILHGNHALFR